MSFYPSTITRQVVPLVVLTLLLAGCARSAAQAVDATPTPYPTPVISIKPTYKVALGEVVRVLEFSARLAPVVEQELYFKIGGRIQSVLVRNGDKVEVGQLLASLETGTSNVDLRRSEINLEVAKLNRELFMLQTNEISDGKPNLSYYEKALRDADFALVKAQQNSEADDLSTSGSTKNALSAAGENEKKAQEHLIGVQKGLGGCGYTANPAFKHLNTVIVGGRTYSVNSDLSLSLVTDPDTLRDPNAKCDPARRVTVDGVAQTEQEALDAYNGARERTRQAQIAYSQSGMTNAMALDNAKEARDDAARDLKIAQQGLNQLDMQVGEADLLEAQVYLKMRDYDVELAQLVLDEINARVETAQVKAPFKGTVLSVYIVPDSSAVAFKTALVLADLTKLEASANLISTELEELEEGLPVKIAAVGAPATALTGEIRKLPYPYGKVSTNTGQNETQDTSTRVSLNEDLSTTDLSLGDLVRVQVVLEKRASVLWLPPQAIRKFEGRRFVVVQDSDAQRRVDVRIGITSDDRVEILEGLEVGQIVLAP